MAYVVMAYQVRYRYGLSSYGLYSYGLEDACVFRESAQKLWPMLQVQQYQPLLLLLPPRPFRAASGNLEEVCILVLQLRRSLHFSFATWKKFAF